MNIRILVLLLTVCIAHFYPLHVQATSDDFNSITSFDVEFAYEAHVTIGEWVEVGKTPTGTRRYIPITGGRFEGPRLKGEILSGGADWQTVRSDDVTELDALYSMQCDDGTTIIVRNQGLVSEGGKYLKTAPSFSAPEGPHAWLNEYQFLGTVSGSDEKNTVIIRVFRVL